MSPMLRRAGVIQLFRRGFKQFFRFTEPATRDYLLKVFAAFLITCVGGLFLE